jgi:hypothetical protein
MITLQSTGETPIEFEGELIHEFSGQWVNGRDRNRYYEVEIYAHEEGGFVCDLTWKTQWQGEQSVAVVHDFDTIEELATWLDKADPLEHLVGFPQGAQFAAKQIALEEQVTSDWRNLRGDIRRALGIKKQLRRGKPPHPLGPCENPGWSLPERVRVAVNELAIESEEKPSEVVTKILAAHFGLLGE